MCKTINYLPKVSSLKYKNSILNKIKRHFYLFIIILHLLQMFIESVATKKCKLYFQHTKNIEILQSVTNVNVS